ncbi:MAG: HDOD domain-containing protein [Sulfurimonas sp.]|nr:HDOD domain-containing protein [Sulfurimonas sp.]
MKKQKKLGCDWFQGYFFAKPKILENAKYEPSQMAVLKLYNLLMQDVNIDEIAKEFEVNHEITVQLLQFINSGSFSFRNKISSIHHVLTLVGRIPLGQWLMLMIYSKSVSKDKKSPLMLMVKHRTELMESILTALEPNVRSNMLGEAYFVGVLSLIDTVFGVELEILLAQMNISQEVREAILNEKGTLGEIFKLVKDIEKFDSYAVDVFEKKHTLDRGSIEQIVFQAMQDVNSFEKPQ